MKFGPWFRKYREEVLGMDLRETADLTDVDASTINRIENERTQPTLDTVVRLFDGLGLDWTQLLTDMVGADRVTQLRAWPQQNTDQVLTLDDVTGFVDFFDAQPDDASFWLAEHIGAIAFTAARDHHDLIPAIAAEDIAKFLAPPSPVFDFALHYPPDLDPAVIRTNFVNGGVLTFQDVGAFIRGRRRQTAKSLATMRDKTRKSTSMLARLESGSLVRIKLADILSVDQELDDGGELLAMFWRVAEQREEFVDAVTWDGRKYNVADVALLLITTCRWLQIQRGANVSWLRDLREMLREG
jgi:transcriptional regulator with XRE-family HTH domain